MSGQCASGSTLILLVGSNPLPNYLAACTLHPSAITLVYTDETESAKDRLKRALRQALGATITLDDHFVEDATCATTVSRAISPLVGPTTHLHYTGGTKVMAAHARLAFQKADGTGTQASYLDEGGSKHTPRLRFDDGNAVPLPADVPLTLETVLALHGITCTPRGVKPPAPTAEDAREILCHVLADPHMGAKSIDEHTILGNVLSNLQTASECSDIPCIPEHLDKALTYLRSVFPDPKLVAKLYAERKRLEHFKDKPNRATAQPFRTDDYGLTLSLPQFPTAEQLSQLGTTKEKESWFEQWYKFIGGEWLEEWLGAQIHALNLEPTPEITVGVNAKRGERKAQLEVDVVVMRGHRAYFISCTTDDTKPICKSKLFEVAVRSRQLGGDLARAALVCFANSTTVAKLQADIDDVWGASNTTRVFGLDDIRMWADCTTPPHQHALKTWLES
ncbi:Card1-like endonuclease domain-containing protein [Candidatus Chloroploca sp. Khr17]|uniref:Card1-like endonuclease domain-containing protein n=1 Tax=Candidatus Chloroploca sp. Khr17 TaxID=2496869 RepID=UPI00101B5F9E|nr:DUF1887 family CARF protein [Candidatus Chloroploca sp. Khr17]